MALHKLSIVDGKLIAKKTRTGVWLNISNINSDFKELDISLRSLFGRVVGSGGKLFFGKIVGVMMRLL